MKPYLLLIGICFATCLYSRAQNIVSAAGKFISTLDANQKARALYPFDVDERYNFHYFPIEDRKGISMNELNSEQRQAAFDLLKTSLSEETIKKVKDIIELETILKALEHRKDNDHFRDPGKYNVTIFGIPGEHTTWGWRIEGHHVSFTFAAQ